MMYTSKPQPMNYKEDEVRGRPRITACYGTGTAVANGLAYESRQTLMTRALRKARMDHMRNMKIKKPLLTKYSNGEYTYSVIPTGYFRVFGHGWTPQEAYESCQNNLKKIIKQIDEINEKDVFKYNRLERVGVIVKESEPVKHWWQFWK